jgi:membrane associated rhomboid family serine protease
VLWSTSLVHLSGAHLLANLLALAVLAVLGACLDAGRAATLALLVAWPLGTLALLGWPQVAGCSGMSGLLHAMVAVLWAHTALRGSAKPVSYVIFAVLALKLLSEHAWSQPIAFDPNWGFNVVYAAHLTGAASGALFGLLFEAWALLRVRARS